MSPRAKLLTADAINWGTRTPGAANFARTEAGAAESFAAAHGAAVRFDHRRGAWLVWGAHRFRPDADGAVIRLALEHVRRQQHQALDLPDQFERNKAVEFWLRFDRRAMLDNLLHFAKHLSPITTDGSAWDADPWLLGTPSGVVDLKTGALRPGRPEDLISLQTAVLYDPAARCPRFLQAVLEWFPDIDLADYAWRALGYSSTGQTTEQVWFGAFNPGAGGKTTLFHAIAHALGDYAHDLPFTALEAGQRSDIPSDIAALQGRRFVTASETCDGARLNEARIKSLTGGDTVTARYLHQEWFSFRPTSKLWLAFNHKPIVRDDSHGFWRRTRLLPFVRTFATDPTLGATLADEGPGILAWLVRGCLEWQSRGLGPPAAVTEATGEYQVDSDVLARFIAEACDLEPAAEIGATDLFKHYRTWADQCGLSERERLTAIGFGRKVAERFPRRRTHYGPVFQGIARRGV